MYTDAANGGDPHCAECTASAADTVACTICEDGYQLFVDEGVPVCVSKYRWEWEVV